ncbi:uncharacterized protein LOC143431779 [Xylocopa sonorina]|uniref:uncharacterized protein LOC143431779 n=1 Tax=Xylocopa sonorina TaxID=1818115 RepID=UPI00403B2B21
MGLETHRVSMYLRVANGSYLRGRCIEYIDRYGVYHRRETSRGIPQGSVLEPLLWNLGYDATLRILLPIGVSIVCNADDTILITCGSTPGRTVRQAEVGLVPVASRVQRLGLELAPRKTEAMWFLDHSHRLSSYERQLLVRTLVWISNVGIQVGTYGGQSWPSFAQSGGSRREGSPPLCGYRAEYDPIRGPYVVRLSDAIRVIRGYRTESYETATTLAGLPLLALLADAGAYVYSQLRSRQDDSATPELVRKVLKLQAQQSVLNTWRKLLNSRHGSHRTVGVVLHIISRWVDSSHGQLTFQTTQMLTGHGCWSEYEMSEEEMARTIKRMTKKNTAPGPDGIPGWHVASSAQD